MLWQPVHEPNESHSHLGGGNSHLPCPIAFNSLHQALLRLSPCPAYKRRLPVLQSALFKLSPETINSQTETEAAFTMLLGPLSLCPPEHKVVCLGLYLSGQMGSSAAEFPSELNAPQSGMPL